MNRYWDLTDQEQAALSSAQVEAFLDVELMEKGVAKVPEPVLTEVTHAVLDAAQMYDVQAEYDEGYGRSASSLDFCFATHEHAQMFIDARPQKIMTKWQWGDVKYAAEPIKLVIVPVDICTETEAMNHAAALEKAKADEQANAKERSAHAEARKAVKDATSGVWEDWHEKRDCAARAEEVKATLDEYVGLCDGDEDKAWTFLGKTHDDERLREYRSWFGLPEFAVQAAPSEAD